MCRIYAIWDLKKFFQIEHIEASLIAKVDENVNNWR